MDSSVSPKGENWFLRVCHYISNTVYIYYFCIICKQNSRSSTAYLVKVRKLATSIFQCTAAVLFSVWLKSLGIHMRRYSRWGGSYIYGCKIHSKNQPICTVNEDLIFVFKNYQTHKGPWTALVQHLRSPWIVYTKYALMFSLVAPCDTVLKHLWACVTNLILTNHSMHCAFCGFMATDLIVTHLHMKLQCIGKQNVTTIYWTLSENMRVSTEDDAYTIHMHMFMKAFMHK